MPTFAFPGSMSPPYPLGCCTTKAFMVIVGAVSCPARGMVTSCEHPTPQRINTPTPNRFMALLLILHQLYTSIGKGCSRSDQLLCQRTCWFGMNLSLRAFNRRDSLSARNV